MRLEGLKFSSIEQERINANSIYDHNNSHLSFSVSLNTYLSFLFPAVKRTILDLKVSDSLNPILAAAAVGAQQTAAPVSGTAAMLWRL